jgi:hypothetical protein
MSLLTSDQMKAIRKLGELGMTQDVVLTRYIELDVTDESNPFGSPESQYQTYTRTVKGWLVSQMERTFDEDGTRIVAIHDLTLRVPVGTQIDSRDIATINGETYTVMESNIDHTWPEWTVAYIKKIS